MKMRACDYAIVCASRADFGQPTVLLSREVDLEPLNILGAFLVLAASVFYAAASVGDSKLVIRSSTTTNSVIPKRISLRRGHNFNCPTLSDNVRRKFSSAMPPRNQFATLNHYQSLPAYLS